MKRILLLGAGTMGSVHARSYQQLDSVQIAGIVDLDVEKARKLAEPCGAAVFASIEEALSGLAGRIDVVDVCLPTPLHADAVTRAADAGCHVICEKPLAGSVAEAERLIRHCRARGVRLFVGHVVRFFPEYERAKKLLDSGKIGPVGVARAGRRGSFPRGAQGWYADFGQSGGVVLDLMIHDFDFLRWCFGDVERVYAKGLAGSGRSGLDYALATLRFASGTIAHVEGSWAHETFSTQFELAGKTGVIDYDSQKSKPVVVVGRKLQGEVGGLGVAVPESPLTETPYLRELKHFIGCIEQGAEPIVTAEDALEAVRIAAAAQQSIATGKPVSLNGGEAK
jgi:predicted dehydrogenase